ncbi:hypothetical protein [Caballeronia sp. HLA56]
MDGVDDARGHREQRDACDEILLIARGEWRHGLIVNPTPRGMSGKTPLIDHATALSIGNK